MSDQKDMELTSRDSANRATPLKPRERTSPKSPPPRCLPPWRVLLHNDDVNDMSKVVRVVRQLTHLSKEEAIARTLEADQTGVALLLITHQERAELYVEQFATYGLTVSAEPER